LHPLFAGAFGAFICSGSLDQQQKPQGSPVAFVFMQNKIL